MSTRRPRAGTTALLRTLRACRWEGRRRPLEGRLQPPVPRALRAFGRGATHWREGVFPADLARLERAAAASRTATTRGPVEYRLIGTDAEVVWVRHWFDRAEGRTLRGLVQIIDREKALEAECIRLCEHERTALGRELHDDVGQMLAGIAALLRGASRKMEAVDAEAHRGLETLIQELGAGMVRTRALAHGLALPPTTERGLRSALLELADAGAARHDITIEARFVGRIPPHSSVQLLHLHRIAQEAIDNAVRHGGASRVDLRFAARGRAASLAISDNGRGLPPPAARPAGLGLHLMGYRAAAMGGVMDIASRRRRGTTVTVQYECPAREQPGQRLQ